MTTIIIPPQDPRYADSGRREAIIGGKPYPCSVLEVPPEHPDRKRCSHIVTCRWTGIRAGMAFTANGQPFVVVMARDPNRDGPPHMVRKFVEILCNPVRQES